MTPNTLKEAIEALKNAALDLHEAAGRFSVISKLSPMGCSSSTREAALRADAAIQSLRKAMEETGSDQTYQQIFAEGMEAGVAAHAVATDIRNLTPDSAGSGWMPIETAPKDGTEILLFESTAGGPMYRVGNWDELGEHVHTGKLVAGWTEANDGYIGYIEPTHWQPLPTPPAKEGEPT